MKKLLCLIFGHRYRLLRNITRSTRELECKRCKAEFWENGNTYTPVPLTPDLKAAHDQMFPKALKKLNKDSAEVQAAVKTYNRILSEAKSLQLKLELSSNLTRRRAYDGRIQEKVTQLNQMAADRPDIFSPITIL